jgi:O-antigen/teichoic acid export membrane protein
VQTRPLRHFITSVSALFSINAMTLLGGIFLPIVIARVLGVEALGIFSTASALGLLITTIIDWGYETRTPLLIRATEQHNRYLIVSRIIARIQIVKAMLWCVLMLIFWAFWYFQMSHRLDVSAIACGITSVWALARGIMASYAAALRGLERFRVIAIVENAVSLAMYVAIVVILVFTQNLSIALLCLPVAECIKTLVFQRYIQMRVFNTSIPAEQKLSLSSEAHQISLASIIQSLRGQTAFVLIQALGVVESRAGLFALAYLAYSQVEVGYFGAAMRFIIALRTFVGAVFNVVLSSLTEDNPQQQRTLLFQILIAGGGIACVGSMVLYFAAEPLLYWVYGQKLLPATTVLQTVAPLFALQTVGHIWEAFLLARSQERNVNIMLVLSLIVFGGCLTVLSNFTFALTAQNTATSVLVLALTIVVLYSAQGVRLLRLTKST